MLLEAREPRKLVTNFDDPMPVKGYLACLRSRSGPGLLVGLEEEPIFTIIDDGHVLELTRLSRCELDVGEYPGLMSQLATG